MMDERKYGDISIVALDLMGDKIIMHRDLGPGPKHSEGRLELTREQATALCEDIQTLLAEPKPRPEWQQRVIEERKELAGRLAKLRAFTCQREFDALTNDERRDLYAQEEAMANYSNILSRRIAAFK